MPEPLAFATPAYWANWLAANHATQKAVWLLYHKKASGTPSVYWQQAVIEALAWGWIDGIRKSVDQTRWMQRFTPRKPGSARSQINRAHAERLIAPGRMQSAGMAQVQMATANGRRDAAYSSGKNADMPQDFIDALATAPQTARTSFDALMPGTALPFLIAWPQQYSPKPAPNALQNSSPGWPIAIDWSDFALAQISPPEALLNRSGAAGR